MLSQRGRYALRAVLVLAANSGRAPMRTPEIARAATLPTKFLENVLLELRKGGVLVSYRGRKGGFALARPPHKISFADILRITDGSLALSSCASEVAPMRCPDCFDDEFCEIRRALSRVNDLTSEVLRSYDVGSAMRRMRVAGKI